MFFVDEPIGLTLAPAARINASNCVGWSLTAILETWAARKGCVAPSVLALGVHPETAGQSRQANYEDLPDRSEEDSMKFAIGVCGAVLMCRLPRLLNPPTNSVGRSVRK